MHAYPEIRLRIYDQTPPYDYQLPLNWAFHLYYSVVINLRHEKASPSLMHSTNSPLSAAAERMTRKSIFRAKIDIFVPL